MPNVRTLQVSFAGGEVSPEMWGRIDDTKNRSGLATCRNFISKAQGPVENRAGFAFVHEVKDSTKATRIISFTYSTTQTMVIEVGAGYFRFHTVGATLVIGAVSAWATSTAYVIGDLVSNGGTKYYCLVAHTSGTFATDLAAGKWYAEPAGDEYEIPSPYAEADLFDIHYVQSADVLTLVHPNYAPRELRRYGATNWQLTTISFTASVAAPTGVTATASGHTADKYTYYYVVTAVAADGITESVASSVASDGGNLLETGGIVTVSWSAVAGASYYNIYKASAGIYGFIGQTADLSVVDDNIAPDLSKTPPTYDSVFGSTNNYPGATSYYEQRRCFAGTINQPPQIWMTKSGTESCMSHCLPVRDDDRISFKVSAREANTIRHIVPLSQLVLLTSAAEWRVTSINSDAITPTTINVKTQSYVGASNVQPLIVNNSLLYGAARGGHVRELGYNWQANGFVTGDLSLRAVHLFDTYDIVDMAYAKAPQSIAWFVSSSGFLIGLTYVPEQNIGAWHWHDTDGVFESCAVVAEGDEDVLYTVVHRTIDGSSVRYIERMASRLFTDQADAFFVDAGGTYDGTNATATTMTVSGGTTWGSEEVLTITASSGSFVFPGVTDVGDEIVLTDSDKQTYRLKIITTSSTTVATAHPDRTLPVGLRSTATTLWAWARDSITGLTWLEGATVSVLADGAVHPPRTVSSGAISLQVPAVKAQIGLPITADLQTLPVALQVDSAFGQGRTKNVNMLKLRVYRSSGIWAGPSVDALTEYKQRTIEPYGAPPALKTNEISIVVSPSWDNAGAQLYVRQTDPLPLTIVSLTAEVLFGS